MFPELDILDFAQKAGYLILILSAPPILISTAASLLVAVLQALTQIQDQSLGVSIKLVTVVIVLIITSAWMGKEMISFSLQIFSSVG